jgi:uncharacterized delta-60 repeat protein
MPDEFAPEVAVNLSSVGRVRRGWLVKSQKVYMRRLRDNLLVSGWRKLAGILALTVLSAVGALAQPVNDNFTSAESLDFFPTPGTVAADNTGATREVGEPLITTNSGGASIWFSWTAPADCVASFNTTGSSIDTLLGIYVGDSVDQLTPVAQDDNSGGGGTSAVTFSAPLGTKFYIAVDGSNGVQGNIVLNWATNALTTPGTNDAVANAWVLTGTSGSIFDNNVLATAEPFEAIGLGQLFGTNSMWYVWTAPSSGVVTFNTRGSTFDTVLDIYPGTNQPTFFSRFENDDFLALRTSQASFQVVAGQSYQISVNGFQGASGFIRLNWNLAPLSVNDNFANATALNTAPLWGSVTDNNLSATAEAGEPTHASFVANHSLWYKWLAPQDGEVALDTVGSSFDTVLAVYNGGSVATLSQVAANDDLYPTYFTPGSGNASQFNIVGMMFDNTNIPVGPGFLLITNGSPTNFAFGASDFELIQPFAGLTGTFAAGSGASGLRFNAQKGVTYYFAVDGKEGTAGQFNLNWAYHPSGVFKFAGETRDQTTGVPSSKTVTGINGGGGGIIFLGGIGSYPGMLLYQTAETEEFGLRSGRVNANQYNTTVFTDYRYDKQTAGVLVTVTRVAGSSGRVTVGYTTVDGADLHDHYRFDPLLGLIPDGSPIALSGDAPAVAGRDYSAVSGTLTFDDFEMSKTILIPIIDDFATVQHNRDFGVVLFNPQRDPAESTLVSQPRLDTIDSQALVRILDADIDPRGFSQVSQVVTNIDPVTQSNVVTTNLQFVLNPTNAVFNFLKANYRIPEDVSDYWGNTPITVYVARYGTNKGSASISYRINAQYLDSVVSQNNNEFPLQPGSDYASTGDTGIAIKERPPVDFTGANTGTLTWGANDFDPKPITFTVNNDTVPEFNEDIRLELYDVVNNVTVPVGAIGESTVTIMFDDEDPPAGSVDQFYNPDFSLDIIPPVNGTLISSEPRQHPGTDAQSQVNALVVQPDDKTIIGGDFTSYNGTQRHGIARIETTGDLDTTFDPGDGINIVGGDFISDVGVQADGKIVVVGSFSSFNGQACGNIIRLNTNGTIDASFRTTAGSGANGTIRSVVVRLDGKIIIGGDFNLFNGTSRKYVARLNADGSVDSNYNPGNALNNSVYTLGASPSVTINTNAFASNNVENDVFINVGETEGLLTLNITNSTSSAPGNIFEVLYGGTPIFGISLEGTNVFSIPFGPVNGITSTSIEIIVNPGGSAAQNIAWAYNATVQTYAGERCTVGGDFTSAGGVLGSDHIARLGTDGAIDLNFDAGSGANDRVRSVAVQVDGKAVVGGDFSIVNGQSVKHITRLNVDGTIDTDFFSGIGTDASVYHLRYLQAVQGINVSPNDKIFVGGPFSSYNGTHRLGFARLNFDGSVDTSFLDTAYNQFAGLPRRFFGDRLNAVFASGSQTNGDIMIGGSFDQVGGGQFDPLVRSDSFDVNEYYEPKQRVGVRNRNNVARLIGGSTAGPGNVGFLAGNYPATKSQGFIYPLMIRNNGSLGYASANFSVVPGSAQAGVDFFYDGPPPMYPIMWEFIGPSRMHSDGLFGTNTVLNDNFNDTWSLGINGMDSAIVTINNTAASGNTHATFQLANPPQADQFFLGGENIPLGVGLGRSSSPFNIADDGRKPGTFGFTSPTYASSSTAVISVTRTNGNFNSSPILVDYATTAGSNTVSGVDYFDTSGTLTFNNGETLKTFPVQVVQSNYISSVEKTVNLTLFDFPAGASTGLTNAVLRLINPNFPGFLNFASTNYVTNLNAGGVQITVNRNVGSKGTLDVQVQTANGTGLAGVDYVATTKTVHWDNGDVSPKTVTIPFINGGGIGGSKTFFANLVNPLLDGSGNSTVLGATTNATITINNDNNYGVFEFSANKYVVNEATNGFATVTVLRTGSALSTATMNVSTVDGTAVAGVNYIGVTNQTLSFVQGQTAASFVVHVLDDAVTNTLPFFFNVVLSNPSTGAVLGSPTNAQVTIIDSKSFNRPPGSGDVTFSQTGINSDVLAVGLQPDGMIVAAGNFTSINGIPRAHVARFAGNGSLDTDFLTGLSGMNGSVFTLTVQSDGRILVGGAFGTVNGVVRNRIARLGSDGTLDVGFSPGSGADGSVFASAETFDTGNNRKLYIGGAFTLFESVFHPGIVRVNDNGIIDPGFVNTGVNGIVYAIAVYPTNSIYAGKVLIAGSFTTVNGVNQTNIARLNFDGSLDTNFVANADGIVRALAIQNDNAVVVGGEFNTVNGVAANRLARLNVDGTVDTAFASTLAPGIGDTVNAIALQSDNRIVVVGQFLTANGLTRHHITRLMPNGAADPTINFGDGANGDINAVAVQSTDQSIVIGGGFTQYNDVSAPYLTRIYGGSVTGSGNFEFTSASYQANENGLQAAISVRRAGGTSGPNPDGSGNVSVLFTTTPGSALPGVNYMTVVTNVYFPPGEVLEQVFVPLIDDHIITTNTTLNVALSAPSAPAGLGDQTNAVLTILNTDSSISFSSPVYQVAKNVPTGLATVTLVRAGGTDGSQTVGFTTTTNGTAVIGTDYTPTNSVVIFNPGDVSKSVQIAITNNNIFEGDRTVTMLISNILDATIVSPSNAVLTIKDTTFSSGQLSLANTNFFANEGDGTATISVIRTGGSSGSVSTFYYTTPGTAIPGLNYISVSNNLTFSDGQTNRSFTVPLIDNSLAQGFVNFNVTLLTNLSSGATLASPTTASVFIIDNDSGFQFTTATNTLPETAGQVAVNVLRVGPTNNSMSINYATHDGTALAGTNYTATSGTLTFSPGQTLKSIQVPILDDPRVTGDLLFTIVLSTNAASAGAQLAYPSTNTVVIQDADAGLSFTNDTLIVRRDIGSALITVVCSNPSIEPVVTDSNTIPLSVQYTTVDGTGLAGVDYIATSGVLVFTNGNGTNTFNVPIINNTSVSGARTFSLKLFNPTFPGRLVAPSNEVVTIVDGTAGFKFSKSAYSANKTDGSTIINVFRTGLTDSVATVDFVATNGSAIDGVHYFATNGTLLFTNGVTNMTFTVRLIDTPTVQPNKTVALELFNPSNSIVTAPSAATLTIRDNTGSFVVPSGATLVSESGPVNDVIDPSETVTAMFAFRDAGGLNVGNLSATLTATAGVTPVPSVQTQVYGPLLTLGHSVSKPFTFTASGTNGQEIVATFALQDGTTNIGTAVFGFQLGSLTTSYTNGAAILINDHAVASPYPSVINVSNALGSVLKATMTLTNLAHASPGDIDAVLVSPAQQTVLIMAHAGGQNSITNTTLIFDDAASTTLPQSGQIISGTNKPSAYLPVPVFP